MDYAHGGGRESAGAAIHFNNEGVDLALDQRHTALIARLRECAPKVLKMEERLPQKLLRTQSRKAACSLALARARVIPASLQDHCPLDVPWRDPGGDKAMRALC